MRGFIILVSFLSLLWLAFETGASLAVSCPLWVTALEAFLAVLTLAVLVSAIRGDD
jgi:hypothetical protein